MAEQAEKKKNCLTSCTGIYADVTSDEWREADNSLKQYLKKLVEGGLTLTDLMF